MYERVEKTDIRKELFDWAQALVSSLIVVILLFTFVARIISVDGGSMNDTLIDKNRILISNLFYTPDYGDIIVFTKPGHLVVTKQNPQGTVEPLVKRVIAMGGDWIDLRLENGVYSVYLLKKGTTEYVKIEEPYLNENNMEHWTFNDGAKTYPYLVPEGKLFVMGDNRIGSMDSRTSEATQSVGVIDKRWVLGHLLVRLWPNPGAVYEP